MENTVKHSANNGLCSTLTSTPNYVLSSMYSCRQKWCPEYEAGLFKIIVEHTAAKLFDAATQDRSTTDTTMRVGV